MVPAGLQAAYAGAGQLPFVDLNWSANTDGDLAGYNIYRHEASQQSTKINADLIRTPAYRDDSVAAGKTFFYCVTSVDIRGNESAKSEEASETVPAQ